MNRLLNTIVLTLLFLAGAIDGQSLAQSDKPQWYQKKSQWNGFDQFHFEIAGQAAYIVAPKQAAPGNPWIWRARFPGYHSEMDVALVGLGFHIGYVNVAGMFGSPRAIEIGNAFYSFATKKRNLAHKVCLEGVSRGGLLVYNWAAQNADNVAAIYCDTPVCDFKSWPGGLGKGLGSDGAWKNCLQAYGFSRVEALAFEGNPLEHAEVIAKAKIPLLHIVSENDRVVPPNENTYLLRSKLRDFGHDMDVISVEQGTDKSNGHHFTHPEPQKVVDFFTTHAMPQQESTATIRIACVGDSITFGARVDQQTHSYPSQLQILVGRKFEVRNFGVGGATLIKSGRPNVWQKLEEIKDFKPHHVIISLGTNDTVSGNRKNWEKIESFEDDYREFIAKLNELPTELQISICTPTAMVLDTPGLSKERLQNLKQRQPRLQELCKRIRTLVDEYGNENVTLLELNGLLQGKPELLTPKDGVHPNAYGYKAIAEEVAEHIQQLRESN